MEFLVTLLLNADAILNQISVAVGNWNSAERRVLFLGFSYPDVASVLYRIYLENIFGNVIFIAGLKILVNDLWS